MPIARRIAGILATIGLMTAVAIVAAPAALADSAAEAGAAGAATQTASNNRPFAAFFDRLFNRQTLLTIPVAGAVLTSGYGMRRNPILGTWTLHAGIDLSAPRGTAIYAAGDGIVMSAEWEGGYGYTTRIIHPNGVETVYAHQSRIAVGVTPGAAVVQGQTIGLVGATGNATGPHLHYEILVDGEPVDPLGAEIQQAALFGG